MKIVFGEKNISFSLADTVAIFTFLLNLLFAAAAFFGFQSINALKSELEDMKNSMKGDVVQMNMDYLSYSVIDPLLSKDTSAVELWNCKSVIEIMTANSIKYSKNEAYLKYDKKLFDAFYANIVIKLLEKLTEISKKDNYKKDDIEKFKAITYSLYYIHNIFVPEYFDDIYNKYKEHLIGLEKYIKHPEVISEFERNEILSVVYKK